MTNSGGANSLGTIFKTNSNGTNHTLLYEFQSSSPGADPTGFLVEASNGNLYGITRKGGKYGRGVIFEVNPVSLDYSVKADFNEYSAGSLTLHSNGKMYGTAVGWTFPSVGIIFEFDPATSELTAKADFEENSTGAFPNGELLLASNGKFYGETHQGGLNDKGVLFEYDPTLNSLIKRFNFADINLNSLSANNLIQANNGRLYGFAISGSPNFNRVIFEFDITSNFFSKIIDLTNSPNGRLINSNGFLYSMANGGITGAGTILKFDIANATATEVIDFSSFAIMSASSLSKELLFYADNGDHGSLFGFVPPNGIAELIDLAGIFPLGEPIRHSNGKIYGLTDEGLFEINLQSNSIINKPYFSFPSDGGAPRGSLTQHPNGNFYGVTQTLGENNMGVIFEFNPNLNSYRKIIDFNGTLNGSVPYSDLVVAKNGKLYGTTFNGGVHDAGVIFEVDPYSNNLVSKKVDLDDAIGGHPFQSLFLHSNGKLYGISRYGVTSYGAIFEFDPDTNILIKKSDLDETVGSPSSGFGFRSTFTEVLNGKLLAVTSFGGSNGKGCIFEFDVNAGSISKKIDFTDDLVVTGNLVPHPNGMFYATSTFGNKLYEYDLFNNKIKVLFDFESNPDYGQGLSSLTLNPSDNNLYGMALIRGSNDLGTIFKYNPTSNTLTKTFDFNYLNGANPNGDLIFVKSDQTISFDPLPNKTYGDLEFTLNATASSGLGISYVSSDPTIALINGTSVTILKAGEVTIIAQQAGDGATNAAQSVEQILRIDKANAIVTADNQTRMYNSLNPNLTFQYSGFVGSDNANHIDSPPLISCDAIQTSIPGNYSIILSGGSDDNYLLTLINSTLIITKAEQLTVFQEVPDKVIGDRDFQLNASTSSGLAISYTSNSNKVVITSNNVVLLIAGRETITASQIGNDFYNPAISVSQSFCIRPAKPTITFKNENVSFTLESSSLTGNQWYLEGIAIEGENNATLNSTKIGNYTVQVSADDCKSDFSEITSVTITGTDNEHELQLYPNPVTNFLFIKGVENFEEATITNTAGQEFRVRFQKEHDVYNFDVQSLSAGIYFIKLFDNNRIIIHKFLKK
jgi:uncharacterized repeat protein (TIGR03803 family)